MNVQRVMIRADESKLEQFDYCGLLPADTKVPPKVP